MDPAAAAAALGALHAHLHALLPDLLKLEELLRASLAHEHTAEVASVLHQRQQQCVAAVALLRGLPAGAAGREVEGLQALVAARHFVESSSAMIQDVQVGQAGICLGSGLGVLVLHLLWCPGVQREPCLL